MDPTDPLHRQCCGRERRPGSPRTHQRLRTPIAHSRRRLHDRRLRPRPHSPHRLLVSPDPLRRVYELNVPAGIADLSRRPEQQHTLARSAGTLGDSARTRVGAVSVDSDQSRELLVGVGRLHNDLPAAVATALATHTVRKTRRPTLRARRQARRHDLVLRATLVRARVRLSLLWDGHEAVQCTDLAVLLARALVVLAAQQPPIPSP